MIFLKCKSIFKDQSFSCISREVQYVVLSNIATISIKRKVSAERLINLFFFFTLPFLP